MNTPQTHPDQPCCNCRFYKEIDKSCGACHRYPPEFAGENIPRELHRWRFPKVSTHDWCGEHRPVGAETSAPVSGGT